MTGTGRRGLVSAAAAAGAGLDVACAVNAAWNALTYVYDPGLFLDVVSLGLVYDVRGEDGVIVVEMTLAGPGYLAADRLPQMARAAVAEAAGGRSGGGVASRMGSALEPGDDRRPGGSRPWPTSGQDLGRARRTAGELYWQEVEASWRNGTVG
jgi:metal-sulfur cluster biosynthetic enzyme